MRNNRLQIAVTLGLAALAVALRVHHHLHPIGLLLPALGMGISFNAIPSALRIPFVAVEFDSTQASVGPALLPYRVLIIGQKTSAGSQAANTLVKITSETDAIAYAGRGSMLHRQVKAYLASNSFTETWLGVLADNGSGVAATSTLTVTGPATAAGTLMVYVGGVPVAVGVASGDAATAVAANINAAVNAALDLPVTSTVSTNVVTLTARNKGTCGNDIDVRLNYQDGDKTPAGLAVAIVAMASGATNPTLGTLVAAMGDTWYHVIAHPYTDSTSLGVIEAEMLRRAGPMVMHDGLAITSAAGTQSTLATLGQSRNSQFSCIVAQPGKNPVTQPCEFAAETAALVAYYGAIDPARPFQTLQYTAAQPPAQSDLFTNTERNLNLFDGIATSKTVASAVTMDRLITTYQLNGAGAADTAYLDANTTLTLMYLRYSFRNSIQKQFPRHKLADDGVRVGAGQPIVTPKLGKAVALSWFRDMEDLGLVQNFDAFKANLVVQRNATDHNRLDVLLPPDLINQLVVTAVQIQFR